MTVEPSSPVAAPAAPARRFGMGRLRAAFGEAGSERRTLATGGAWNLAVFVAGAATAFALRPFVVDRLGDALFGAWSLVASLTGYLGFADLGVRPAVVHYVARHDARGAMDEVNAYVNSAFVVFAACGAAVLVLGAAAAPLLTVLFPTLPSDAVPAARLALLLCALDVAVALPLNAFSAVLVGKQRFAALSKVNLVVLAGKTAAVVALLSAGAGIVALAAVNLAGSVLEMGVKSALAFRAEPRLVFRPSLARRAKARELLGYGLLAVLVSLSLLLVWQTDALVVGALVSVQAVTWFSNGACLPAYARQMALAAGRVLEPAAGALSGRSDDAGVRRLLASGSTTMLRLALPALAYLVAVGDGFLARWLGASHRPVSTDVLAILAIGVAAPIGSYPFTAVMYGTNRMRPLAAVSLIEGVANLALSLALAPSLGLVGVAIGTAVPALVVHGLVLPRVVGRAYGFSTGSFLLRTWAAPTLAAVATGFLLRALAPQGTPSWALLAGLAILALAVFHGAHALLSRALRPLGAA
jgi:O-antigen/teichoic acid export membrane protein